MNLCFVGDYVPIKLVSAPCGIAIGNLECAFADGLVESGKAYTSVLPNACMDNLGGSGFTALSLANNHVNDAGNFAETYSELKGRFPQIQFFGTNEKPYAEIKVKVGDEGEKQDCSIFIIGCLEPCRSRGKDIFKQENVVDLINKIRISQSSKSLTTKFKIYVYPHWGMEGEYTRWPSPAQRKLAKQWIDAGADGVIGNHSHVPQGMELYKGKPIYYSLGNYFFEGAVDSNIPASADKMLVEINEEKCDEQFLPNSARAGFIEACGILNDNWTRWNWAKKVGTFYLKKNESSWYIRLRKNFLKNFPKFLVWQCLPKVLFFRFASWFRNDKCEM